MERGHFQLNYDKDSVSVDFVIEYDPIANNAEISALQLNTSSGKSTLLGLPIHPTLEYDHENKEWYLYENDKINIKGNDTLVKTKKENKCTRDIVNEILRIKDESIPRFFQ